MEKEQLLKDWIKHKNAESRAKEKRLAIERDIEQLYSDFPENSKTFKEEEIGFSVNLKKNFKYNLNQDQYLGIRSEIPEDLRPEKVIFSLDLKGYEWLRENNQEIYRKISDCVEFKINKPTIKVEKIKKKGV